MTAWIDLLVESVTRNGPLLLGRLLLFAVILAAGWLAAVVSERLIGAAIERSPRSPSPLFTRFVVNVTRKAIWLVAVVVGLDNLGVDTGALIAGVGASGLVFGFAMKDTLSNFAAGALVLLYSPFEVGDWVEVAGYEGSVQDLTLVYTLIHTGDNKVVTIPNSEVWGAPITNFYRAEHRRIDLVAGIGYDDDIDDAIELFREILDEHELVLDAPSPVVRMKRLGESSVDIDVRGWVRSDDYWTARPELVREIKVRCDDEGIDFPYPHRSLDFVNSSTPPADDAID